MRKYTFGIKVYVTMEVDSFTEDQARGEALDKYGEWENTCPFDLETELDFDTEEFEGDFQLETRNKVVPIISEEQFKIMFNKNFSDIKHCFYCGSKDIIEDGEDDHHYARYGCADCDRWLNPLIRK